MTRIEISNNIERPTFCEDCPFCKFSSVVDMSGSVTGEDVIRCSLTNRLIGSSFDDCEQHEVVDDCPIIEWR